jgi:hypothetical protein
LVLEVVEVAVTVINYWSSTAAFTVRSPPITQQALAIFSYALG